MYENTIRITRPHPSHACESMPCGKIERNINACALANYFGRKRQNNRKQIKTFVCQAGFVKKKHIFFAVSLCLRFERPVEVAQMKTTHSLRVVVAQKKPLVSAGNVVNAF